MNSNMHVLQISAENRFISRDGYEIDFDAPTWKLNKDISIPVVNASKYLNNKIFESYRKVLAFYAKGNAPSYVSTLHYQSMNYFHATTSSILFSTESLISYRHLLGKQGEHNLSQLRAFIKKWAALGYEGIADDVIRLLNSWTLSGGERGAPIRSMCPERGPLTDIEMEAVINGVTDAYAGSRLSLFETSIAMTVIMTGRRPIQITALKIGDLTSHSEKYFLNVPRAKQRTDGGWRKTFKQIPIIEDLWLLLQQQAAAVYQWFTALAGVNDELKLKLPLFPNYSAFDKSDDLSFQLNDDRLHLRNETLKSIMVHIAKTISVNSERTGAPILMNAYRFRYTLGTNLGREGKGEYVIAEALDHTDTQHTGVYVKNLPEIVERIDKAVAYQLAPIAQAFQGIIIKTEHDAQRGSDPSSRISNGAENLGSCGSYGFCSALAPVACYTCNHFQPWLDGPHEGVLDHLLQERNRILDLTDDRKVASVNDRLILAVSDVIIRCKKMKEEITHG